MSISFAHNDPTKRHARVYSRNSDGIVNDDSLVWIVTIYWCRLCRCGIPLLWAHAFVPIPWNRETAREFLFCERAHTVPSYPVNFIIVCMRHVLFGCFRCVHAHRAQRNAIRLHRHVEAEHCPNRILRCHPSKAYAIMYPVTGIVTIENNNVLEHFHMASRQFKRTCVHEHSRHFTALLKTLQCIICNGDWQASECLSIRCTTIHNQLDGSPFHELANALFMEKPDVVFLAQ